ncbi:MAG: D-aminoacylase [Alphaproteobacteria bacterium]|nr:D-aminoacylase [Alphaproteobacteria bacterium]
MGGMPDQADLVIRNGTVIDGTGAPRRAADIAVNGARIAALGAPGTLSGRTEIDAAGRMVAPGFIDVHTHDDAALIDTPDMSMKVSQGVTTVITGNCGVSAAPILIDRAPPSVLGLVFKRPQALSDRLAEYVEKVRAAAPAVNAAFLIGHSTLRMDTMGEDLNRPASAAEIRRMRERLGTALEDGAIGMSSGLFYPPAMAAKGEEVAEIAEPLGPAGAVYTAHIRDEGDHIVEALEEAFRIGRHAGAPVVISHHKCSGRANFGRTRETLPLFERAMREQRISLDVYPYTAGSTILRKEMVTRAERVLITWSTPHPEFTARYLDEVAREFQCSPEDAVERLLPAGAIYFMMDEEDVRRVLQFPAAMIGSDGIPGDQHPHPRLWGTFPRVLGHYARDLGLFSLEEAVHRMSGLSARNFGLAGRGEIREGAYADIVIFDHATIADLATFEHPIRQAAGIESVLVNGEIVWQAGHATGRRPGRALLRQELQQEAARN